MQKKYRIRKLNNIRKILLRANIKIDRFDNHKLIRVAALSILLAFILEILSRRSIWKSFAFIISNPLMFLLNASIILLTLSLTRIIPKRSFFTTLVSLIWVGFGITNFIMQCYRTTPFTAMDFYLLKSAVNLLPYYLKPFQMILLAALIITLIAAMVLAWKKAKRVKSSIKYPLVMIGISTFLILTTSTVAVQCGLLSKRYGSLPDAFSDYGFVYCFTNSIIDQGIRKPELYSENKIDEILQKIEKEDGQDIQSFQVKDEDSSTKKPNIIMVQLESFFDVNLLKNYSFSENPIPNFTRLKEQYSSGYLTVPVFGAGTVNTEFEVISGMSTKYFGTGEYPYRTIMKSKTCESICYNLEEQGYHSCAIHNNTATFYDRNHVLPRLGFDNFISIEYMNPVELNQIGWAKDKLLKDQIFNTLEADNTRNFIYTITVQSHGKYPDNSDDSNRRIQAFWNPAAPKSEGTTVGSGRELKSEIDNINKYRLEYYVNQLNDTDRFIGELTAALSDYEEPVIIVFFGDHLPPLSIEEDDLQDNNKFQTEYVLWSNYPMDNKKLNLAAYQLNAYLMERAGFEDGLLTKFHQRCFQSTDYEENLKILQYDMLYGKHYVYNGRIPYIKKTMRMGVKQITVEGIYTDEDSLIIKGENFTPWSVVCFGDKKKETAFIDDKTLKVTENAMYGQNISVKQVTDNNMVLSESNGWKR